MPLDIRNLQFYETAAAWVWMAVVLPAANRARHGGTAWCFLHSKEESGVYAVFFLTVWIIGSIGAMACWVAHIVNHRTIPEHTASLLFLACHGALVLVATGFEVHLAPCPHERRSPMTDLRGWLAGRDVSRHNHAAKTISSLAPCAALPLYCLSYCYGGCNCRDDHGL